MAIRQLIGTTRQGSLFDSAEDDRVQRFIAFADEFLRVPHGHGATKRFRWAPTQMDWIRSFVANLITVVSVGRGGGKSTLCAAVALWWAVDPPEGDINPEIVIVANSRDQSKAGIFNSCVQMVEMSPRLQELCHVYTSAEDSRIKFLNGAVIRVRAAHKTRLQGLIPSLMVCDEIGGVDAKVWATLVQSLGKRPGASLIGVGTPLYEREVLFDIYEQHNAGKTGPGMRYLHYGADPGCDLDDVDQWRKANPVRAELNPDGWIEELGVIRSAVSDEDWQLMHLCIWADLRGKKLLSPEQFGQLEGLTVERSEWVDLGIHVGVVSDWERRSVAVVAAVIADEFVLVQPTLITTDQPHAVPVSDILDAVMAVGDPVHVTVSTGSQAGELVECLEEAGCNVTPLNVASPAKMSAPSDTLIRLVKDDRLRHDVTEGPYRLQMLSARLEVGRDGVRFVRDDRQGERTDAVVATAVAAHGAHTSPRVAFY